MPVETRIKTEAMLAGQWFARADRATRNRLTARLPTPIRPRSYTVTAAPRSLSSCATVSPATPPPMTMTCSAIVVCLRLVSCSGARPRGRGIAVSARYAHEL